MKRLFILILALSMIFLPTQTIIVHADNMSTTFDSVKKYRYDIKDKTLCEVQMTSNLSNVSFNNLVTENGAVSPAYVPDGLSVDPPPDYSPTHLLGSWTAINPATGGQYRNTVLEALVTDQCTYTLPLQDMLLLQ